MKQYLLNQRLNKHKEKMNKKFSLFLICFLLSITFLGVASAALNVSLSDQGTDVKDKSTGNVLTSGNLEVSVYDNLTGGNLIYNEMFGGAIADGSWNVMLGENSSNPLQLEFGKIYYKDYEINGLDLDFTDFQGNTVERQFFYSPLGDISGEDISANANLIVANINATNTGFFGYLGSLVNRVTKLFVTDINASGNVDVGGNLTAANADFNGGWLNNGLSIIDGDIYAQTGYFYNITSLNITKQNLTLLDDLIVQGNTFLSKNLTVDTNTLFVDSGLNRVGIRTTSPSGILHTKGGNFYFENGNVLIKSILGNSVGDILWRNNLDTGYSSARLDATQHIWNIAGNEKMRLSTEGFLGIGTTSPSHKLTVQDTSTTSMNVSDTLFVDGSNNRVGIGTSSPSKQLHIVSNTPAPITVRIEANTSGYTNAAGVSIISHSNITGSYEYALQVTAPDVVFGHGIYTRADGYWGRGIWSYAFGTRGYSGYFEGYHHYISGLTGIGDTEPDAKLDVLNTGAGTSFRVDDSSDGDTTPFLIDADGKVGIGTSSPTEKLDIKDGNIRIDHVSNANLILDKGTTAHGADILYRTAGSPRWTVGCADSDFLGTGADFRIGRTSGDPDIVVVQTSGFVGIGTASPQEKLHVAGNALIQTTTGNLTIEPFGGSSTKLISSGSLQLETGTGTDLYIAPAGTATVIFRPQSVGGNVGIGTASPTHKLTVQDTSTTSMNVSDILFVDGSGKRVGIGTSSPTERLHIGYAHIGFTSLIDPGALTATVGAAGNVDIGTHYYRVAYVTDDGESYLGTVTGAIVVADSTKQINLTNIPVSSNSFVTSRKIYRTKIASASFFYLVATINDNTATTYTDNMPESSFPSAYKYKYGLEDTSAGKMFRDDIIIFSAGEQNTLMGYAAGTNLDIDAGAYFNTYVGAMAGIQATLGSGNTGVGTQSLYALTTGSQNTAIGSQALRVGTTFRFNTAIGATAGFYTTGEYNTFIGRSTGYYNVAGAYNVMVGSSAGIRTVSGSENTLIGTNAGAGSITGQSHSRNTFLGYGSGQTITNGSDNVFLGYKSGYNELGSNKLYISNSDTATPLIYGEFDNNILSFNADVGIGTASPSGKLHVNTTGNSNSLVVNDSTGFVGIGTASPSTLLELYSNNSGSPGIETTYYQNSSSPANADVIGRLNFYGKNSTGDKILYAYLDGAINTADTGRGKFVMNLRTTGGTYKTHVFTDTVVSLANGLISTSSAKPFVNLGSSTSGQAGPTVRVISTNVVSSGDTGFLQVTGTYQGSSTAGLTAFEINPTMTSGGSGGWRMLNINASADVGTGDKYLIWAGINDIGKFVVDNSGNVGIGTDSPSQKLDIEQNINGLLSIKVNNSNTGANARAGIQVWNDITGGSFQVFGSNYTTSNWQNKMGITAGSALDGISLTTEDVIQFDDAGANTKVIFNMSSGKVGIGTTSPDGTLHVHTATGGSVTAHANYDDLTIENSGAGGISIITPNNTAGGIAFIDPDSNTKAVMLYNHNTDKWHWYDDANVRITLTSTGSLGIGTVTPLAILHTNTGVLAGVPNSLYLEDSSITSKWRFSLARSAADFTPGSLSGDLVLRSDNSKNLRITTDNGASTALSILTGGNVGIGTTSPQNKLNVIGDINATGGIATDNVVLKTKVIEIGDWNMDTTQSKSVAHSLSDFKKTRSISAIIRQDEDTLYYDFMSLDALSSEDIGHSISINSVNIILFRDTGGIFDSPTYNSTSFNRGWITITYVA